ncbi:MAG TPA: nucleotidyltransferase domain-containing protein [archaeon]|nr:nucleotidyltransferase domain-containing protein [archaeon]
MNKYKNYAISAVSYILQNLPDKLTDKIGNVILFGSVAQDRATNESDVDLFFDVDFSKTQGKNLKKFLNKITEDFYLSKTALQYKLEGVDNKINFSIGDLDQWDLKRSIISTGIVLFGRYKSGVEKSRLKQNFIISWDPPRKNRGAFLNKLYGYSVKNKRYHGMIAKYNCAKIGKSSIIIPSEHKDKLMDHMKKYNINYQIMEIFS